MTASSPGRTWSRHKRSVTAMLGVPEPLRHDLDGDPAASAWRSARPAHVVEADPSAAPADAEHFEVPAVSTWGCTIDPSGSVTTRSLADHPGPIARRSLACVARHDAVGDDVVLPRTTGSVTVRTGEELACDGYPLAAGVVISACQPPLWVRWMRRPVTGLVSSASWTASRSMGEADSCDRAELGL